MQPTILEKIIPTDNHHLFKLVRQEIEKYGKNCDLNHIDVSNIIDMNLLFYWIDFTGDISQWNTSQVTNMTGMFHGSTFNGNISNWNVSKVIDMNHMFKKSSFNQDIFNWDVSNVEDMSFIFHKSKFLGNLSNWKPLKLQYMSNSFNSSHPSIPYWANILNNEERIIAINKHTQYINLNTVLNTHSTTLNKTKNKI